MIPRSRLVRDEVGDVLRSLRQEHPGQRTLHSGASQAMVEVFRKAQLNYPFNNWVVPLGRAHDGSTVWWRTVPGPHLLVLADYESRCAQVRTVIVNALARGVRVWICDPTARLLPFVSWPGVERVATSGSEIQQALLDTVEQTRAIGRRPYGHTYPPVLVVIPDLIRALETVDDWAAREIETLLEDRPDTTVQAESRRARAALSYVARNGRSARRWLLVGADRGALQALPTAVRDHVLTRAITSPTEDSVVEVGTTPKPLHWFWTPDPTPGHHTEADLEVLEVLRERASLAHTAWGHHPRPTETNERTAR